MEPSKSDWRLYREKVSGWQENFMERLIKKVKSLCLIEYIKRGDIR